MKELLIVLLLAALVVVSIDLYTDNRVLLMEKESNRIENPKMASVWLVENKWVVVMGSIVYNGVCELDSVNLDKEGDICNYNCWWEGDIGGHSYYRLTLPCVSESN